MRWKIILVIFPLFFLSITIFYNIHPVKAQEILEKGQTSEKEKNNDLDDYDASKKRNIDDVEKGRNSKERKWSPGDGSGTDYEPPLSPDKNDILKYERWEKESGNY